MNIYNVGYITSQSFGNAGVTYLPALTSVTGSNPTGRAPLSKYHSYSFQTFLTGSNVVGTLYHRVSNNGVGWAVLQTASFSASSLNVDWVSMVPSNATQFADLYWSGSGAGQVTASVGFYGRSQ